MTTIRSPSIMEENTRKLYGFDISTPYDLPLDISNANQFFERTLISIFN